MHKKNKLRKKFIKKIPSILVVILMVSASSSIVASKVVTTDELYENESQEQNPKEKTNLATNIEILNEEEFEEEMEISGKSSADWHQFRSGDWDFAVKDSEWGKIGKVNQKMFCYKLKYDGSSTYDWYSFVWTIQAIPGHVAYGGDNAWHVMDIYNNMDGDKYNSYPRLIDYGPYSTQGQTTVTYNIGVEAGTEGAAVTAGISKSYTIADIDVHDQSDFSTELAKWWHDVNENTVGWDKVITIKPGAVFRVPQAKELDLMFYTKVKFCTMFLGVIHLQFSQKLRWYWTDNDGHEGSPIKKNYEPDIPSIPSGPSSGKEEESYTFSTRAIDPDYDQVKYEFDWGDGDRTSTGWLYSNKLAEKSHTWSDSDDDDDVYSVKVRAQDKNGRWGEWSNIHSITIKDDDEKAKSKQSYNPLLEIILKTNVFQRLQKLFLFL